MTSLMENFDDFVHHRHHDQAATATGPNPAITAQENPMPFAAIRNGFAAAIRDAAAIAPKVEAIALDPKVDGLIDAALEASGLGVGEEVFAVLTGALRSASAARQGTQQTAAPVQQADPPMAVPDEPPAPASTDPRHFG